jgi:hypothetical protein
MPSAPCFFALPWARAAAAGRCLGAARLHLRPAPRSRQLTGRRADHSQRLVAASGAADAPLRGDGVCPLTCGAGPVPHLVRVAPCAACTRFCVTAIRPIALVNGLESVADDPLLGATVVSARSLVSAAPWPRSPWPVAPRSTRPPRSSHRGPQLHQRWSDVAPTPPAKPDSIDSR